MRLKIIEASDPSPRARFRREERWTLLDIIKDEKQFRAESFGHVRDSWFNSEPDEPHNRVDTEEDAFRHAYVAARFAQKYGSFLAGFLGDMNEYYNVMSLMDDTFSSISMPEALTPSQMDFWNNTVGIEIGERTAQSRYPSREAATEVFVALYTDKLKVMRSNENVRQKDYQYLEERYRPERTREPTFDHNHDGRTMMA